jgi:disulfide bond formation protein DsbB
MRKKTNERMDKRESHLSRYRFGYCGIGSVAIIFLVGCAQLKKMALVGGVASVTAGAASALGVATVPTALVTGVAAAAASVAGASVDAKTSSIGENMPTAVSCAPDNFWTLLGDLVSMSGYFLILVVAVPMLLGWILPGPLERKKKK